MGNIVCPSNQSETFFFFFVFFARGVAGPWVQLGLQLVVDVGSCSLVEPLLLRTLLPLANSAGGGGGATLTAFASAVALAVLLGEDGLEPDLRLDLCPTIGLAPGRFSFFLLTDPVLGRFTLDIATDSPGFVGSEAEDVEACRTSLPDVDCEFLVVNTFLENLTMGRGDSGLLGDLEVNFNCLTVDFFTAVKLRKRVRTGDDFTDLVLPAISVSAFFR